MKTIILFMCSVLGLFPVISQAGEPASGSPDSLIHDLYTSNEAVFAPQLNPEVSQRFLTEKLFEALVLEVKRSADEPGVLDFDVLTFSQDTPDIKKFTTKSDVKGDSAVVKASFENYGERTVIGYQCVKEGDEWRIADVNYEDGTSLVKLLSGAY